MSTDYIDTEATEIEEPRQQIAVRQAAVPVQWTPSFTSGIDEAVARVQAKNEFFKRVMREGDHYGVIPGTGTKPALLKPGAELLLANMGLYAEFSDEDKPEIDITGRDHNGEPYIRYRRTCRIFRQTGLSEKERMVVGKASGSCSSWEKKYRYRNSERICPTCGKPAIIKGRTEYGGGYVCFKKKDGCGAKFGDNDNAILGQEVGQVPNPDIADTENTILKMADKRALVAATLIATGCSDIFTQDVEDFSDPNEIPMSGARPQPAATPPPQPAKPPTGAEIKALYADVRKTHADLPEDVKAWAATAIDGYDGKRNPLAREVLAMQAKLLEMAQGGASTAQPVAVAPTPSQVFATLTPPSHDGTPLSAKTRNHLMGNCAKLGWSAKADRLVYAEQYGLPVTSFSDLSEAQGAWLADRAWDDIRKSSPCPACNVLPGEPHMNLCPEAPER